MLLYEFEGKQLFKNAGINVPAGQLVSVSDSQQVSISAPLVLKAQTLSGKRAEGGGIVRIKQSESRIKEEIQKLFNKTVNGEKVEKVLVEQAVDIDKEYYLSFSYDTAVRGPVMTFGQGGTGVEKIGAESFPIYILAHFIDLDISKMRKKQKSSYTRSVKRAQKAKKKPAVVIPEELVETIEKLWGVFLNYDCELAEINPLVVDKDGMVWALDSKVILDDDADFRREINFSERNLFGRPPTESEIEARKIDEGDHRGTAGSVYWDLSGDIAVIAAGGGGSIVNMDALLAYGGKPANYTEHSGNPPREKLKKLTKIVLSKPGLKGCWFVGGTANFTDIYETLMGFVEALREIKPKPTYPIVIRRGGPRDKEAFEALREIGKKEDWNFHIYGRETPMTSTAKIMVDLAYK